MSRTSKVLMLFALFATTLLVVPSSFAQSTTAGDIVGTVTDPSGAIVSGATVTLKNNASGETQTATTSGSGEYRFSLLRPGTYTVGIQAAGFQDVKRTVTVGIGQATRVNVPMAVTSAGTTVEVTAQAPALQTENGNISTTYSADEIAQMPNPGNDTTYVAQTAPGAMQNTGGGYGNFQAFGLPAVSNLFTVNGNDNMDPFLNLNNTGATNLTLGSNELAEATVVNNGYSGQYGRQAGSQINYTTMYGTNNFHGNAIYYWNGRVMNANNWFNKNVAPGTPATDRPFVNANQWAARFGGPVWKDKTFFFVDTEGLRFILPTNAQVFIPSPAFQTSVLGTVPAAQRPFYQNLFNLYNSAPGAGSATPATSLTTPTTGCGDFTGLGPGVACANVFRSTAGNLSKEWMLGVRVDQVLGSRDRLWGRFKTDHGVQATSTSVINPLFNAFSTQPQFEGQLNETHTFGNSAVNSFIASGSYYSAIFDLTDPAAAIAAQPFQVRFAAGGGRFASVGPSPSFPQGRNVSQYQGVDDFSIVKGRNNLKFGVNYRRDNINDQSGGIFSRGRALSLSLTDFASGIADQFTQAFPQSVSQPIAVYSLGAYAQDQWKVSNKLSLDLSLRMDHNSNPVCQRNCFNRFSGPFSSISHDIATPYNQTIQTGINQAFPNIEAILWQPRLGFAFAPWGPEGKTVIRGGFGIFYDMLPGTLADNFLNNAPGTITLTDATGLPLTAPGVAGGGFASLAASNAAFQSLFAGGANLATIQTAVPAFAVPDFNTVSTQLRTPQFQEWNLMVQQQFGDNNVLELNYVGHHAIHIPVTNTFPNAFCDPATCVTPIAGVPTGAAAPDPRFGTVSELYTGANSNYNGLTTSFKRKMTHGLMFTLNYTWSHSLDEVSNGGILPYDLATYSSIQNQLDPTSLRRLNYGNADYDFRHQFNANFVWDSGFKFNNWFVNQALGGWVFSGATFTHSAYPFTAIDSSASGLFGNFTSGQFAALLTGAVPNNPNGCNDPNTPCFDVASFAPLGATGPSVIGNQRRNQLRGPHYFNADFSVQKNFRMTENSHIGVGASFFNVFNHPNFDIPDPDVASPTFGSIISTVNVPTSPYGNFLGADTSSRIIQLNARIVF